MDSGPKSLDCAEILGLLGGIGIIYKNINNLKDASAMTKADLINHISEKSGITRVKAETVVNTIFDSMVEALLKNDRIEIRGFGSFEVRVRQPRQGRNPKTGESVDVGLRKVPFFKVGKELRERVNNGK